MLVKLTDVKYRGIIQRLAESFRSTGIKLSFVHKSDDLYSWDERDGRLFTSDKKNRLPMKAGDARIAKLGRDFLETDEVTKEQYDKAMALFKGLFDAGIIGSMVTTDGVVIAEGKWYGFKRKVKQEPMRGDY